MRLGQNVLGLFGVMEDVAVEIFQRKGFASVCFTAHVFLLHELCYLQNVFSGQESQLAFQSTVVASYSIDLSSHH